ncbi:hypothetical protein LCGC14_1277630 [marine sediment metagenome]|uniref:Asparagine synthetase domain-containing protein n=1 Tax=marine sediment metagenome TaxID=412755 RepID=A0A0F9NCT3_9ZZZZ
MSGPLAKALRAAPTLAIAVSGGVDSLTLAHAAMRWRRGRAVTLYHAVSPAVPAAATARVHEHADRLGAPLVLVEAGEFADPDYLRNPVNRCFFCKSRLYDGILDRIGAAAGQVIAAGTNLDDLGDFRPGLEAARQRAVRHPLIEAGLDKRKVRRLARRLGLGEVAELAAAPCLASRVETGLRIDPQMLRVIDAIETQARSRFGEVALRCRQRAGGLVLELEADCLAEMDAAARAQMLAAARSTAHQLGQAIGPMTLEPYRKGSAFLHG